MKENTEEESQVEKKTKEIRQCRNLELDTRAITTTKNIAKTDDIHIKFVA